MLSKREERVLFRIVEHYVNTGEPVASKLLCSFPELNVSPATIRNDMAVLSDLKLIYQPHTSAGRIPTEAGLRYYIDNLMHAKKIAKAEESLIKEKINFHAGPDRFLENIVTLLSDITNCATIYSKPGAENDRLKKVTLTYLGEKLFMVIVISYFGLIKNRVCRVDSKLSAEDLEFLDKLIKEDFVGKELNKIDAVLLQQIMTKASKQNANLAQLILTVFELVKEASGGEVAVDGRDHLFTHKDYGDTVYDLMEFLDMGDQLIKLVDFPSSDEIHISIGSESKIPELTDSSLIVTNYQVGRFNTGRLGILGPIKINYSSAVAAVTYMSKLLGEFFTSIYGEE
ncbi:MAG: heat-inducible transcriptional repressor HrcA [Clostridia bacterium]|nr:heat-inducible transcriptional repressor HrcA [Clostridia bacterium]